MIFVHGRVVEPVSAPPNPSLHVQRDDLNLVAVLLHNDPSARRNLLSCLTCCTARAGRGSLDRVKRQRVKSRRGARRSTAGRVLKVASAADLAGSDRCRRGMARAGRNARDGAVIDGHHTQFIAYTSHGASYV